MIISIHAPQWGATCALDSVRPSAFIFQSTHPSGVRLYDSNGVARKSLFQSTHPSGVRLQAGTDTGKPPHISIHAPQWGATFRHQTCRPFMEFQSTHPSGVRRYFKLLLSMFTLFQSTHPSGVRPSREIDTRGCHTISIHAPQWGATYHSMRHARL